MKASEEGDGEMEKESAGAEARRARADAGGGAGGCAAASGRSRDRSVRAKAATVGSDANAAAKRARPESRPWLFVLLSYAGRCRGKMAASLAASVVSVAMGFVPFYAVYRIMEIVMGASGGEGGAGAWDAAVPWIAAAAAAYVASKVLFGVSTLLSHVSAYTILARLRRDFAAKLMRASLGTVQGKSIGQIKNVFIDRIEGIEPPLAHMIPELSGSFLLAAGLVAWLAAIDWRMALACVATVPAGLVVFAGGLSAFNRMYAAYVEEGNRVNSVIVEYIEGIEVVKAFNQASDSYEKYAGAVRAFRDFTLGWFKATWVSMNLATSIMPTTLLAVVPVGLALYLGGELAPAELGLCLVMALAVVDPAMRLGAFLNEAKSMEYAVADADEFLRLPELPEPRDRARVRGADVELSGVRFSYEEGEEVLHGIDLTIPEGSFVALVGPSGGGKSTVARLVARHWDVDAGSVRIGGADVRDMPLDQLSELVSYVAQDNFLFDCSLRENVRLGRPGATDEEVAAAARAACCDEFVARLPRGWDTPAGEAGSALSGGERQRVSIARAMLKDAPIVVLDEATAFADPENEDRIQRSIAELTRGKTLVVIAHRLSTVCGADKIVVIEDGSVRDEGAHEELLERCALYADMWEAHVGAKGWAAGSSGAGGAAGARRGRGARSRDGAGAQGAARGTSGAASRAADADGRSVGKEVDPHA